MFFPYYFEQQVVTLRHNWFSHFWSLFPHKIQIDDKQKHKVTIDQSSHDIISLVHIHFVLLKVLKKYRYIENQTDWGRMERQKDRYNEYYIFPNIGTKVSLQKVQMDQSIITGQASPSETHLGHPLSNPFPR